jgi:hypothetical protein
MFYKNLALLLIVPLLVTIASYTAEAQKNQPLAIPTDGLASYWTLDEIKDNKVKDIVGENDGFVTGKPTVVKAKFGNGLKFDGGGDWVLVTTKGLNSGNQAMSVSAWFFKAKKGPAPGGFTIFAFGRWDCCCICFNASLVNGKRRLNNRLSMSQWGCGSDINGPEIELGKWHHVAAVYDGAKKNTLYYDGVEIGTKDIPEEPNIEMNFNAQSGGLGLNGWRPPNGEFWDGILDDIGFYNRALTAAEVARIANLAQVFSVEPGDKLGLTWGQIKASR